MGGAGDDSITIGSGSDEVDGGAGKDSIKAKHTDLYPADATIDTGGIMGDDEIDGGAGTDTLVLLDPSATTMTNFVVNLGSETVGTRDDAPVTASDNAVPGADESTTVTVDLSSVESVTTSKGDDVIVGNGQNNTLKGSAGADFIHGMSGDDKIEGGDGDDVLLYGCSGNDTILGGAGNDVIVGVAGADRIDGGDGIDILFGDGALISGAGTDSIAPNNDDSVEGDTFVFGNGDRIMDWDAKDSIDIAAFEHVTEDNFYAQVKVAAVDDADPGATGDQAGVAVTINNRIMYLVGANVGDVTIGDFDFFEA
jgi:Ca2+-binding RTX toxin-like protein